VIARHRTLVGLLVACAASACGGRPSYWDTPVPSGVSSYGLANAVALVDDSAHRVVMLTALADQELATRPYPIGHNVATATTSADGTYLFVLSTGDTPRRTPSDQDPSLTVLNASGLVGTPYSMTAPFPNLAIDPLGHWAVAYTGAGAPAAFVQNANELVIFDLSTPGALPVTRTIQSRGGIPQRLTFTPPLQLPTGQPQQLLIVETDIDVTLLELTGTSPEQLTIPLTSGTDGQQVQPAGVVVAPQSPGDQARIALRAVDNANVFTFTLGPSATADFQPVINVIDVGGTPTDIAFVHADMGLLRVAALVPSTSSAMIVDPDTSVTTQVMLPEAYQQLSLVTASAPTSAMAGTPSSDLALLWNAQNDNASGVAFWQLGDTVGQPYFSVQPIPVSQSVQAVDDVAGNPDLKVLETANAGASAGFYVLDLVQRTAAPLETSSQATLAIAPDGLRLWAFAQGGTDLAMVGLVETNPKTYLNPVELVTELPIDAVYDVARPSSPTDRSLIAIHTLGTVGATVFDALDPDTVTSRRIPALLLEGP
jgi:hypothetical protein